MINCSGPEKGKLIEKVTAYETSGSELEVRGVWVEHFRIDMHSDSENIFLFLHIKKEHVVNNSQPACEILVQNRCTEQKKEHKEHVVVFFTVFLDDYV